VILIKERVYVMNKTTGSKGPETACQSSKRPGKDEIEELKEKLRLDENICGIAHKIMVMSGKGGVGKSSIAANIAVGLSMKGKNVGLMDIDIHGPSIPRMVGLEGSPLKQTEEGLMPVEYSDNLKVMSIGFLIRDRKDAVIWRAPLKHSLISDALRKDTDMLWEQNTLRNPFLRTWRIV
jgi:ATP-binding protein involved in chromosome partitioning